MIDCQEKFQSPVQVSNSDSLLSHTIQLVFIEARRVDPRGDEAISSCREQQQEWNVGDEVR